MDTFAPWLKQWIQAHENLVWWMGVSSVVMFLSTLGILIAVIVMLPSDHFVRHDKHPPLPIENPVLRISYQVIKNLVGLFFILAGLVMLMLPGQGLISLIIGLSLTSFPGKRGLIRFLIRRKTVFRSANWFRAKFARPPLKSP